MIICLSISIVFIILEGGTFIIYDYQLLLCNKKWTKREEVGVEQMQEISQRSARTSFDRF